MPSLPSFAESELRLGLAEKIGKLFFNVTGSHGRVAFEIGGAQAIELAAKIARKTTGKSQFVVFEGGFHGRSGYASQLSASHRYRKILGDWRIPLARLPLPDYERSGFPASKARWIKWYLAKIDELLHSEVGGVADNKEAPDIAALIIEPILNVSGMILPDSQLIEGMVQKFRKAGALIIIDEIFTGFYRTGKLFGFCRYNISPDVVVASKGLTNGQIPIGIVWAQNPLLDADHFPPGTHSATFINNVMALSVADTVLDRYLNWKTIDKDIQSVQNTLSSLITRACQSSPLFKDGYALGGLGRITLSKPYAPQVRETALSLPTGLMLASTGMTPDVINIHPPINLSFSERKEMSDLFNILSQKYA
jgi:4-aminobutyrate aminotransferase-like enzyme